jgi:hypothetical protein
MHACPLGNMHMAKSCKGRERVLQFKMGTCQLQKKHLIDLPGLLVVDVGKPTQKNDLW